MNDRITDLLPWLTLNSVPGVGGLIFRRLMDKFGTPEAVLNSNIKALTCVKGISVQIAEAIIRSPDPEWARNEADRINRAGIDILTLDDIRYPTLLKHIPDPPPILYVKGRIMMTEWAVAIVGSRKATAYGRSAAYEFGKGLAQNGITVVSGMALGIDTAAHQGALAGGGPTIAVLGSGFNHIYPVQNLKLSRQITENGCMLTEFPMDAPPDARHFPRRNRIISGMCLGTVVVEAAPKSGSLITARLAAEQNREVFAVPGSIRTQTARGTHDLIKQGAKLVETIDDILEEIAPQLISDHPAEVEGQPPPVETLSAEEKQVFSLLDVYPVHFDTLSRRQRLPVNQLSHALLSLELKGLVTQEPGNFFLRCQRTIDN